MVNVWQSFRELKQITNELLWIQLCWAELFKAIAIAWLVCLKDVALLVLQEHGR